MAERNDPSTHRVIQTREGIVRVPRTQEAIPLTEFFKNVEWPKYPERGQVLMTEKGPVLIKTDPVQWSAKHDLKASEYAERLREQINEKGYYKRSLGLYADKLTQETGANPDEVRAIIADAFRELTGSDLYAYLQDRLQEAGLPVRAGRQAETERGIDRDAD